jgi:hypothetical protein
MKPRSKQAVVTDIKKSIQTMIRKVFNTEFFGTYEAIIETINEESAVISVSVPSLNDLTLENCRIMTPCLSDNAFISPTYNVGDRVIITCNGFKLKNPIILGQIRSPADALNLQSDTIVIQNGGSSISIDSDGVITIAGGDIVMTGDTITAEGEDLTSDNIGAM